MESVFVVADAYTDDIYCVTLTEENARQAIELLTSEALKDMIAEDPNESGIDWELMTAEEKEELTQDTRNTFYIQEVPFESIYLNDGRRIPV